ncbi:hypothetical protein B4135_1616 [Caldibacillus debilis]|uniref:Uncharacterized protein n=1 Tax=Caldibacillus debilis TaxID=301148 RepID=A0A150MBR7_9BACI|nr:hypothetical protein B4135_1616 [Caldibacillus debilis]
MDALQPISADDGEGKNIPGGGRTAICRRRRRNNRIRNGSKTVSLLKTGRSLRSQLKWAGGSAPCLLFKADRFSLLRGNVPWGHPFS